MPRDRGQTDNVAAARAVNAEPWEPLPGMEKHQCPECRYFFAAPPDIEEPTLHRTDPAPAVSGW